ncbi:annulin-like [Drosophila rhopaloa]|uniref:Transglutaminase-like domain-containing protein n=1 Tax=Drosophila rhopaloa TaxID=1041015 RepID=A0ABM5HKC6_DRORH|nr:annulin-like [Drosophila rhopaloa]
MSHNFNMLSWLNRLLPHNEPRNLNPFLSRRPSSEHEDATGTTVLGVLKVDPCMEENHKKHHTRYFNAAAKDALIVRRGEPFRLRIHFDRDYSPSNDSISFIFSVADDTEAQPGMGTFSALVPHDAIDYLGDPLEWGAGIESIDGGTLTVLIKPPANCPVTQWQMEIDTKLYGRGSSYSMALPIYVLFNPWCPDDQVYLEDSAQRKEYVLNDTTIIWVGFSNSMHQVPWKVGQFEHDILECSLHVLGAVGKIPPALRGDPVRVARSLSALVNVFDDNGILWGKWSETNDYSGGVAPFDWTGSMEILQKYYKNKKPVKYAQCWVFGGVLATIARSLGIPTRIISCFNSAHDIKGSLTLDIIYDSNNNNLSPESSWNFHVWNELWMKRPDLGVGQHGPFDGWQVVDSTPQERSMGLYQLGPAPVSAVKNGEVQISYECNFVFAEVNADMVKWRYTGPNVPVKLLSTDTQYIGQNLSTKAVLKWEREDVTANYKFAERSKEERSTMFKALKKSNNAYSKLYLNDTFKDIEFDMEVNHDIKIGEDFSVVLKMTNKSESTAHVAAGEISCDTILYNGKGALEVKAQDFELELQPQSTGYVHLNVVFKDYFEKLRPHAAFQITATAKIKDTKYEHYANENFMLRKPDIKFKFGDSEIVVDKEIDVIVRLENPLPIPLQKGIFTVEGPGIKKPLKLKVIEVPVGGTAAGTFKYTPPYAGRGTLLAKFTSKELDDVSGYKHYEVEPQS